MQKGEQAFWLVLAVITGLATTARAEEVQHLTVAQPGGFPGRPILTGITKTTNGVNITWDGPSGYYQLYQATNLTSPTWKTSGTPNLNRHLTLTNISGNAFFKVSGPSAQYAGSQACAECHEGVHNIELTTRHTQALQILKSVGQGTNAACLPCHTVGFGLPTGFKTELTTPHLAGVQCESCHGPAAAHAANEMDLTKRPRKEIAGQVCGGCHNTEQNPTFEQWKSSGHFTVVEDMNPTGRINSCGRCHSGTARLAMVKGVPASVISTTLTNDANVGITCVVCHDPHQTYVWTNVLTRVVETNQLRYPVASTNYFSLSTSATFSNRTDINVCAQCHNDRGAAWTSNSRPPHHSPQYNLMMGTVGIRANGSNATTNANPASHGLFIEKQCVGCHMPTEATASGAHPGVAGHSFQVTSFESCRVCHGDLAEDLVEFTKDFVIEPRIQQLKASLDLWGTTKSPLVLRTNYGAMAWEYTTPGELSSGTNAPPDALQAQIPSLIKQARFNLYIVNNDGSFGVHNPLYAIELLDAALGWVQSQLTP